MGKLWKILLVLSLGFNAVLGYWYWQARAQAVKANPVALVAPIVKSGPEMQLNVDFSKTGLSDDAWKVPAPQLEADPEIQPVKIDTLEDLSLLPKPPETRK